MLPETWIASHEALKFKTFAVYTTREESITATVGLPAARETYALVTLEGEGELVES